VVLVLAAGMIPVVLGGPIRPVPSPQRSAASHCSRAVTGAQARAEE
jgi:hypothetical protein